MGGRRRREGLPELLQETFLHLPWWVGPPAAGIAFVGAKLIGQMFASGESALGQAMGPMVGGFAPLAAVFVLIIWAMALCQKAYRRRLLASREGIQSIRALSWRDFELLVGESLRRDGYAVEERGGGGADGGVDLVARRDGETMLVQCKHWKSWDVGVRVVREVYGVMTAERAASAMIVTTGRFSRPARSFAEGKPLQLLDGDQLAALVAAAKRTEPTSWSVATPTLRPTAEALDANAPAAALPACPRCGAPMVVRTARRGANAGTQFLGCSSYPKCKGTRELPR